MHGKLYKNKSDKIVMNKNISQVGSRLTLHFKDESEIIRPTIIISRDVAIDSGVNYIYVEDLNRYYFVDEITLENQRYIIRCTVDVLMSHKEQIMGIQCVVGRNKNIYNMFLNDDRLELFSKGRVLTFPFENGFTPFYDGTKYGSLVLTLNGGGALDES